MDIMPKSICFFIHNIIDLLSWNLKKLVFTDLFKT